MRSAIFTLFILLSSAALYAECGPGGCRANPQQRVVTKPVQGLPAQFQRICDQKGLCSFTFNGRLLDISETGLLSFEGAEPVQDINIIGSLFQFYKGGWRPSQEREGDPRDSIVEAFLQANRALVQNALNSGQLQPQIPGAGSGESGIPGDPGVPGDPGSNLSHDGAGATPDTPAGTSAGGDSIRDAAPRSNIDTHGDSSGGSGGGATSGRRATDLRPPEPEKVGDFVLKHADGEIDTDEDERCETKNSAPVSNFINGFTDAPFYLTHHCELNDVIFERKFNLTRTEKGILESDEVYKINGTDLDLRKVLGIPTILHRMGNPKVRVFQERIDEKERTKLMELTFDMRLPGTEGGRTVKVFVKTGEQVCVVGVHVVKPFTARLRLLGYGAHQDAIDALIHRELAKSDEKLKGFLNNPPTCQKNLSIEFNTDPETVDFRQPLTKSEPVRTPELESVPEPKKTQDSVLPPVQPTPTAAESTPETPPQPKFEDMPKKDFAQLAGARNPDSINQYIHTPNVRALHKAGDSKIFIQLKDEVQPTEYELEDRSTVVSLDSAHGGFSFNVKRGNQHYSFNTGSLSGDRPASLTPIQVKVAQVPPPVKVLEHQPLPLPKAAPIAQKPVAPRIKILKFGGEWCPPCIALMQRLRTNSSVMALVEEIDSQIDTVRASKYGINYVPVLVFELNGQEVSRFLPNRAMMSGPNEVLAEVDRIKRTHNIQ